ncbi:unnamed protein product (plasmid) [Mycetohabitans rhizoxinica HKI 454]|uniref:Uncharacterized protein n=1 Tax=Mycetohabitans rhizoxinica (strain DSM 19002 / CIP 109453 / HKI 454) TaxID=882378 RepID=E5ATL4_MYCRK|nr:unnamed protein product [Mycetohabitans rhizoxinica HKI 454]
MRRFCRTSHAARRMSHVACRMSPRAVAQTNRRLDRAWPQQIPVNQGLVRLLEQKRYV